MHLFLGFTEDDGLDRMLSLIPAGFGLGAGVIFCLAVGIPGWPARP